MDYNEKLQNHIKNNTRHSTLSTLMYYLQMNNYTDSIHEMFDCTPFDAHVPYYYCQTGMEKSVYHGRVGVSGKLYSDLYYNVLIPALSALLDQYPVVQSIYMIVDDSKELGIVFQPKAGVSISPIAIAEEIDHAVQQIYDMYLPNGTGRYCNTTALSEAVTGPGGIRAGYKQTEILKAASFFRMTPGVLTAERLAQLKNSATYRDVISACRALCHTVAQGEEASSLAQTEHLFLDLLKHSFDAGLVCDALSYLKHFLSVRLAVYLPEETIDLAALCDMTSYVTIEECFAALFPVLSALCHAVHIQGAWSDLVADAAYFLRIHLDRDVSLSEIAAYADTTSAYLSNLFHQQTGMTIKQYQQQIRMERARTLLEQTDEQVSAIAGKTGFFDRRYFTKTFKEFFGVTPAQYRESVRKA